MEYTVGMSLNWTPMHWKWDTARVVTVTRTYPRGKALLDNGVVVDDDGFAQSYAHSPVGRVTIPD